RRTLPMSFRNSCSESVVMSGLRSSAAFERAPDKRGRRKSKAALDLRGGRDRRIDVLDKLDLRSLEESVQLFDVRLVEVELGHRLRDLRVGEHPYLLALGEQALDLVQL